MRIIISQKERKIEIIFDDGRVVDKCNIDKAEKFLACVDNLMRKRHNVEAGWKSAGLEFRNVGILTERVIRAIMLGLCF